MSLNSNGMLFVYDNRVEVQYGVYGAASGRTHRGIDVDTASDDRQVHCTTGGTVISSAIITDKSNLTWEWGHYVSVQDAEGCRHYYCHLASRAVKAGDKLKAGDVVGMMGKTGNAAYDKQAEHVHYEVRKSPYKSANAVDPTPFCKIPNRVGTTWNNTAENVVESEKNTETGKNASGKEWETMLLRSFGEKNMQGFYFPDHNGAIAYDHMPCGYRLVAQRGLTGADAQGWEWVKLLDERTGGEIYTPLLSDRNTLLEDYPALVPSFIST